jgi:hypothetical protein
MEFCVTGFHQRDQKPGSFPFPGHQQSNIQFQKSLTGELATQVNAGERFTKAIGFLDRFLGGRNQHVFRLS